ncbi:MAG: helix-turn-helix domain-containing protein [Candidatus Aenigmarchaeota archaeon]|nr:helix-turn-helix domain-containing protein [Candidatus Aenigmarchaeota archaeon]
MITINEKNRVREEIIKILGNHPEGLTVQFLSDRIGVSRHTIIKYIFELKGSGIVYRRRVGSATLHYLKSLLERLHKNFEEVKYEAH